MKASELLRNLSPCEGEVVESILDDSKKQKRGKAIEAVNWVRGHKLRGNDNFGF